MSVSKSAVQKRTFPDGTASGLDADLKHRAPLGPLAKGDTEPCRVGTWSFSARRWDWSPRSTLTEPPLPADDERRRVSNGATSPAPYPSSAHSRRTAIDAHQAFNSKVASGWSNEGREVFAAWILVLLVAALAVLLLASHQPNTKDLRLPQWSDPPVAGAESWVDDRSAGHDGSLAPALDDTTARNSILAQEGRALR